MASDHQRGWSAARFSCTVCEQPVQAVAHKRRKVFGAYVPVWEPGPCENPDCPLNAGPPSEREGGLTDGPRQPQHR